MEITNKTTEKQKVDELMKQIQEEQMKLHPEIYEKPQKETKN